MENQPQDVMYALGHLQSSVESMGKQLNDFITEAKSGFKDLDLRVSKLESDRVRVLAITSTIGAIIGIAGSFIMKVFFHA